MWKVRTFSTSLFTLPISRQPEKQGQDIECSHGEQPLHPQETLFCSDIQGFSRYCHYIEWQGQQLSRQQFVTQACVHWVHRRLCQRALL